MAKEEYKLTPKQRAFADEYIANKGNATKAYKKAYENIKNDETASVNGSRLLTNAKVSRYIKDMTAEVLEKRKFDVEQLILTSWGISMGDVQKGYTKQYDHLEERVIKEITYDFTPTLEERQRSIEFLTKLLKYDPSDKLKDKLVQAQIDKIHKDIIKDETAEDKLSNYLELLGSEIDED